MDQGEKSYLHTKEAQPACSRRLLPTEHAGSTIQDPVQNPSSAADTHSAHHNRRPSTWFHGRTGHSRTLPTCHTSHSRRLNNRATAPINQLRH
jgi:hypothetical protein